MAIDIYLRNYVGGADPVDPEGFATKQWVESELAGLSSGSGSGGLVGAPITDTAHTVAGDLALDLDGGADYVFDVDLAANITGLAMSNVPAGMTEVRLRFINSTGTAKTVDLTGDTPAVIPYGAFGSVVSVAAGEAVSAMFEAWET